jgi:hypothetical protein
MKVVQTIFILNELRKCLFKKIKSVIQQLTDPILYMLLETTRLVSKDQVSNIESFFVSYNRSDKIRNKTTKKGTYQEVSKSILHISTNLSTQKNISTRRLKCKLERYFHAEILVLKVIGLQQCGLKFLSDKEASQKKQRLIYNTRIKSFNF